MDGPLFGKETIQRPRHKVWSGHVFGLLARQVALEPLALRLFRSRSACRQPRTRLPSKRSGDGGRRRGSGSIGGSDRGPFSSPLGARGRVLAADDGPDRPDERLPARGCDRLRARCWRMRLKPQPGVDTARRMTEHRSGE